MTLKYMVPHLIHEQNEISSIALKSHFYEKIDVNRGRFNTHHTNVTHNAMANIETQTVKRDEN